MFSHDSPALSKRCADEKAPRPEALLIAPETRSSAPVRVLRKEDGESPVIAGLFPAGEGSGYSGGIVSSAMDGERIAGEVVAK